MAIKIQINSLDALERLIGGDSELEIEIRNSVVQNFTKKHLKALAGESAIKTAVETLKKEILYSFTEKVQVGWREEEKLTDSAKKSLRDFIENEKKALINDAVNEIFSNYKSNIEEKLQMAATVVEEELTGKELHTRLSKLVDQRLATKLGINRLT
jgi:hypothetical protein